MDTFSELITAVQNDLTVGSESALFNLDTVKLALNRAYRKAGAVYRWSATEDAKKFDSTEDDDYFNAPQNWRPDSIYLFKVDGNFYGDLPDYNPMTFADFLRWKKNNPNSTEKKWAVHNLRVHFYPAFSSDGDNNVCIWGFKTVDKMVNNNDTTIFSYNMPECNDAIVMEAVAILKKKGEKINDSQFYSAEALAILTRQWNKIRQEQQKYEKHEPMFDVPDFFGNTFENPENRIGNF